MHQRSNSPGSPGWEPDGLYIYIYIYDDDDDDVEANMKLIRHANVDLQDDASNH